MRLHHTALLAVLIAPALSAVDGPATVTAQGITVSVRGGAPEPTDAVFAVAVPAAHWWDDIGHT